jgi:outer membrane receptor protein involved in Fe transport
MNKIAARLCTAVALGICCVAPGKAEEAARVPLNIESQPIRAALKELGRQAGIQVLVRVDNVSLNGLKTPPVSGERTVAGALDELLANTGLKYEFVNERTVKVSRAVAGETTSSSTEVGVNLRSMPAPMRFAQTEAAPFNGANARSDADAIAVLGVNEVVVTAQKRVERLQDVPVPVTAVSGQLLTQSNQLRLEDYYTRIPGLSLTTSQPFGSSTVAIRGVVTGFFQSPTVGIVVDDVPHTSSNTVGFGNVVSDFDPSDLARVEVLRGPQGTLYGASSIGGLIKYVTVDPTTDTFKGRVQGGISSIQNGDEPGYNVRAAANIPFSDTLALRASAFTREDPGFIDNPGSDEKAVNWGRVSGGRLTALWKLSNDVSLKLGALMQDTNVHGSAEADVVTGPGELGDLEQNRTPNSGGYRKRFEVYSAQLTAKAGIADLTSISAYTQSENTFRWDFSWLLGGYAASQFGVAGANSVQDVSTHKFTQELRVAMPLGERIDWLFGAFYAREKTPRNYQTVAAVDFTTSASAGEIAHLTYLNTFEEYAAFTDVTWHVTDRFDVQVGGRQSRNESDFQNIVGGPLFGGPDSVQPEAHSKDSAFTYLLTPRFRVSDDLMFYGRLASGYRPGGPNGGISVISNLPREYGPDKTRSSEVGLKGDLLGSALSFDVSLYHIDWRDIQLQLQDPATFLTYYDNAGEARSQGLELTLESRPVTGLTLAASATWTDAELTEDFPSTAGTARKGDRLPFSSRFAGNLSIDQEFPLGSMLGFVGGSVSYVGKRLSAIGSGDAPAYASYTKSDLRAGLRFDTWTTNLFANNVTDERGVLNTYGLTGVTYIQPRIIGLSVEKTF